MVSPKPKTEKNPQGAGRQSKLTPAVHQAVVNHVKRGNWIYTAGKALGLNRRTIMIWMQVGRGEHPDRPAEEPYTSFAADVEAAYAEAEIQIVDGLRTADDWRAGAWLLEHGPSRDRWAQNITISAQLAPAASILDALRQRALDAPENVSEQEPLVLKASEVREVNNAKSGQEEIPVHPER